MKWTTRDSKKQSITGLTVKLKDSSKSIPISNETLWLPIKIWIEQCFHRGSVLVYKSLYNQQFFYEAKGPNALSLKRMKLYGRVERGAMGSGEEEEGGEQVVVL